MRKNDAIFVISMIAVIILTIFALFSPVYIDDYGYEMTVYSAQGFSSIILIFTEFNILLQVSLRLKDDDFEVKNRFMKWGYPSLFVISSLILISVFVLKESSKVSTHFMSSFAENNPINYGFLTIQDTISLSNGVYYLGGLSFYTFVFSVYSLMKFRHKKGVEHE